MWDLIALVIIVSIALGLSLHDAFWSIVSFSIGMTLLFVVIVVLSAMGMPLAVRIQNMFTPETKAARVKKRRSDLKNDAVSTLVFLWIISPLLIGVSIAIIANNFSVNHPGLTLLLAVSPFLAGCGALFVATTKGQNTKQRFKSLGKFLLKLGKLFLITCAIMLGIGLLIVLVNQIFPSK